MGREAKRSKFTDKEKSGKSSMSYFIIGLVGVVIIAAAAYFFTGSKNEATAGLYNAGAADYTGKSVEMAKVTADNSGDKVKVDLQAIKDKGLVTFDVPGISFTLNNGTPFSSLPVLAYVSPKGDVVVASSLCEPCSGTTFHIEGDQLVCNSCGTRWSLDGLQGVSGGCLQYPPDALKYNVEGSKLVIDQSTLKSWQPRPVQ